MLPEIRIQQRFWPHFSRSGQAQNGKNGKKWQMVMHRVLHHAT
jgi:hypothetical protein